MQPILRGLILGHPTSLSASSVDSLRSWGVKTHMMRTPNDLNGFPFPQAHRDAVLNDGTLPHGWNPWLGRSPVDGIAHRNWSLLVRHDDGLPAMAFSQTALALGSYFLMTTYISEPTAEREFAEAVDSTIVQHSLLLVALSGLDALEWTTADFIPEEARTEFADSSASGCSWNLRA